ncbi:MAG: DUF370 domain-containing protein [Syntrophomonadaceae bacterium]|nr:DUF370 domain-containing protein [Syntrophomonadaceae bacterium]
MYLHLGNEIIVRKSDIIAIIDVVNSRSSTNNNLIRIADIEGKIKKISDNENVKSLIVTDKKNYLSNISSATLWKRANKNIFA